MPVTDLDLAAHLVQSACALRARDALLQDAVLRVRRTGEVTAEDWVALALAVEAALRLPAAALVMLAAHTGSGTGQVVQVQKD